MLQNLFCSCAVARVGGEAVAALPTEGKEQEEADGVHRLMAAISGWPGVADGSRGSCGSHTFHVNDAAQGSVYDGACVGDAGCAKELVKSECADATRTTQHYDNGTDNVYEAKSRGYGDGNIARTVHSFADGGASLQ